MNEAKQGTQAEKAEEGRTMRKRNFKLTITCNGYGGERAEIIGAEELSEVLVDAIDWGQKWLPTITVQDAAPDMAARITELEAKNAQLEAEVHHLTEFKPALKRLADIAGIIGDKDHAGNPIAPELWAEMYGAHCYARAKLAGFYFGRGVQHERS